MKKYYGYAIVANEDDKEITINTLKSSGGIIVKGLMKFILKKLVWIAKPLYRNLTYDTVVFYCTSREQTITCINEVLQYGGWKI